MPDVGAVPDIPTHDEIFGGGGPAGAVPDAPQSLESILSDANPHHIVDSRKAFQKGVDEVNDANEIAKWGVKLKDPGLTFGDIHAAALATKSAQATNNEPPKTIEPQEPVTIPTEDAKHQQQAQLEKDYLDGKLSYKDYIAGVKKLYG